MHNVIINKCYTTFLQISIGFLHIVVTNTLDYRIDLSSQPGVIVPSILVPLLIVVTVVGVLFVIMLYFIMRRTKKLQLDKVRYQPGRYTAPTHSSKFAKCSYKAVLSC